MCYPDEHVSCNAPETNTPADVHGTNQAPSKGKHHSKLVQDSFLKTGLCLASYPQLSAVIESIGDLERVRGREGAVGSTIRPHIRYMCMQQILQDKTDQV